MPNPNVTVKSPMAKRLLRDDAGKVGCHSLTIEVLLMCLARCIGVYESASV
jgi:hypothetical protein